MWAEFLLQIYDMRKTILVYVAVIILFSLIYMFTGRYFDWTRRKIFVYGILYDIDEKSRISMALSYGRSLYVICQAIFCAEMGLEALVILEALTVALNLIVKDYNGLINQIFTSAAIFAILLLEGLFLRYYHEIEDYWLLKVMYFALAAFAILYALYQALTEHERLIKLAQARYLRAEGEEINIKDFLAVKRNFWQQRQDQKNEIVVNVQKKD